MGNRKTKLGVEKEKMTKFGKSVNKFWKNINKQKVVVKLSCSTGIILLLLAVFCAIYFPLRNDVNTNVVNKLGHYQKCASNRSNDVANPALITDSTCRLIIEITHPHLIFETPPPLGPDSSDVLAVFGMSPAPKSTLTDYMADATFIDELYFDAIEMRSYCNTPIGDYYTHFYYVWEIGLPNLLVGIEYAIYMDFYTADGEFIGCDELVDWAGFGEFDIIGGRPQFEPQASINGLENPINIETNDEPDLTNCDHISFFQLDTGYTITPTDPTYVSTPDLIPPGNYEDGLWNKEDPFFLNLVEQFKENPATAYSILVLFIVLIILIFVIILIAILKKKKK